MRKPTEQDLLAMYQMGVQKGMRSIPPTRIEVLTPTCPLHIGVPLWTEAQPRPDGSWLYCPFCRQQQFIRETDSYETVKSVPGMHRNRLAHMDEASLNSDIPEQETTQLRIVATKKPEGILP